ncbi:MAG: PorT family protein [Alistipes sp.]|nr:PorT family protein [Alistipes sp.]
MKRGYKIVTYVVITLIATLTLTPRATAQHTLTLTGGTGVATARFYPDEETKWMWGSETFGLSWRFYSEKPRFVGAVGVDLEYMERGFNFGYAYSSEFIEQEDGQKKEKRTYYFYNRKINTLMLPLVWQPHFYLARNRLRIFIEAAVVLSYNISSHYEYLDNRYPAGKYEWKVPRDNRFGYGLSGGLGFAVLLHQVEIGLKAKYNFGYSDIMKNRNKYYSNSTDGRENPFYYTPLRSPLDNINVMLTVGWRFNKRGFDEWFVVRKKREKRLDSFNFSEQTGANTGNSGRQMSGNTNTGRR